MDFDMQTYGGYAPPPPPTGDFMETETGAVSQTSDVPLRATRWIVFCGDVLTPNFKRTFKGMEMGGESLGQDYKTLAPSKGLLRRCQLTPMIIGYDFVNEDILGDDKSKVVRLDSFDPATQKQISRYAYECFPGNEIQGLMRSQQGADDMGIREVESLRDVDPPKPIKENGQTVGFTESLGKSIQREIFPDWDRYLRGEDEEKGGKAFFKTAIQLGNYLRTRYAETSGDVQDVISVLIESNEQFIRWGTAYLSKMSRLVKAAPTAGGEVYTWSPLALQLFDMLELNKEEFLMRKQAETPSEPEVSRAEISEMREMFKGLVSVVTPLTQIAMANGVGAQAAAQTATVTVAPEPVSEKRICVAIKGNNEPCKGFALVESEFCSAHQPK